MSIIIIIIIIIFIIIIVLFLFVIYSCFLIIGVVAIIRLIEVDCCYFLILSLKVKNIIIINNNRSKLVTMVLPPL